MTQLLSLCISAIATLFVLVPHEFAHAYVAYKNGDGMAKAYGRLTLNPIKHLDPLGCVLCVLTGFGWAKPVPINPYGFRKYRLGLFTTAIAGVVTNYIIAFIAYPLFCVFSFFLLPNTQAALFIMQSLGTLFSTIYLFSLSVFAFNLLPLNPLDGFRVVEAFTRQINPVRRFLQNYGQYILIFLALESFICRNIARYTSLSYFEYFDILGYLNYFAVEIVGYPITAVWHFIFGL